MHHRKAVGHCRNVDDAPGKLKRGNFFCGSCCGPHTILKKKSVSCGHSFLPNSISTMTSLCLNYLLFAKLFFFKFYREMVVRKSSEIVQFVDRSRWFRGSEDATDEMPRLKAFLDVPPTNNNPDPSKLPVLVRSVSPELPSRQEQKNGRCEDKNKENRCENCVCPCCAEKTHSKPKCRTVEGDGQFEKEESRAEARPLLRSEED